MIPSEQWSAMWAALGAQRDDPTLHAVLCGCYAEKHRSYHTLQHLDECFNELNAVRDQADHAAEVELALWFHDAIYEIERDDNEARSAEWARATAIAAGVAPESAERVHRLVLATRHVAFPTLNDEAITTDIDLAILGAPQDRFDEYVRQIRVEYRSVPEAIYRKGRTRVLERFLERPRIFATRHFFDAYELRARANLARALRDLAG